MNLISKLYTGRNISKTLSKKFSSLLTRLGGEERLTEVFADNYASSVAEQASIVNQLQDGVDVADIAVATRAPAVDTAKLKADKAKLISILGGQKAFADFISSNGGFGVKNMAVVIPKELARLGSGGTPTASTTKPATAPRQLIRLGSGGTPAAAPSKPTAASKPAAPAKVCQPITARPATPQGAFTVDEAERLTVQIFQGFTPAVNAGATARWKSLEAVFMAHGHQAPWTDNKLIGIPAAALKGHTARAAKISQVFQTGISRKDFSKLRARDQSDFCKSGGQLRD